jgi:hypothetical protein
MVLKNTRAAATTTTTAACPLRTRKQVAHRIMWHLNHKADIFLRSEILHSIHNLSPIEVVLADHPKTVQSQLIVNIHAG